MCNIRINKADELANPALRVLHSQAEKLHRYATMRHICELGYACMSLTAVQPAGHCSPTSNTYKQPAR